jgi:hypothetical protein
MPRMKWWKLKEELAQSFKDRVHDEGPLHNGDDANNMWTTMATCIRKVVIEELRVTKDGKRDAKET